MPKPLTDVECRKLEHLMLIRTLGAESVKKSKSEPPEDIQKLGTLISSMSVTKSDKVRLKEMVEILIGKKLPEIKKQVRINTQIGSVVVPLKSPNGHNYILGKPAVLYKAQHYGIRMDGLKGNQLPLASAYKKGTTWRDANKHEIATLIQVWKLMEVDSTTEWLQALLSAADTEEVTKGKVAAVKVKKPITPRSMIRMGKGTKGKEEKKHGTPTKA